MATGTGEVALRAAHRGARVSALDVAPALLAQARAKAEREALEVEWTEGDAEALPYEAAAFDAVASCFGVIFAPDAAAAAAELTRVCRPGGRLGLTAWKPDAGPHTVYAAFKEDQADDPTDQWGEEERLQQLLGDAFELEISEGVWELDGDSPESVWELMTAGVPPLRAFIATLDPERLAAFREAMLEYWTGFLRDGRVVEPRGYLLVLGRRVG